MSSTPNVVGYCRACGKALDEASARQAHGTIYCEEHLPAAEPVVEASPYTAKTPPPPMPRPDVSPGIAFFLGFIPGVGAIYNGQYGKGLIHVVIIGLIISILDNNSASGLEPLMSLLLAGFWFYMAFEAYHTAKKRQLGQPVDEFSSILPVRGQAAAFPVAPVVLITLGVIFLLNNLDLLDMHRLLRYWPVALIALGAYMLYVRMSAVGENHER